MIRLTTAALAANATLLLSATAASYGQNSGSLGNPAGMAADTPGIYEAHPDSKHPNAADQLFAHEAALGGQAEILAGKLAARKADNAVVKDFAGKMVSEHTQAGDRLTDIIKPDSYPHSGELDVDHKVMLEQLGKASGKSFDELYIRAQIIDHQKTVQLYEWIIGNGEDPRLQTYAMNTLPAVMRHLEMAQAILSQLTGSVGTDVD